MHGYLRSRKSDEIEGVRQGVHDTFLKLKDLHRWVGFWVVCWSLARGSEPPIGPLGLESGENSLGERDGGASGDAGNELMGLGSSDFVSRGTSGTESGTSGEVDRSEVETRSSLSLVSR